MNNKKANRKSSGKKTMVENATNTAAPSPPPGPRSPDRFENRAAVIELLEEKARQSANTPSDQEEEVYPILINFLMSLTDKQWRVIRKGMRDPTTRMQLGRLCRRVVKVICETAFRVFLPALVQVLEQSDSEEEKDASAPGSDPERSSSTNPQDQEAGPTLLSSSPSSKTSLQRAPVRDPLKVFFGVTADTVLQALGDDTSSSPELTRALVGETLSQLNSAFSVVVAYTPSGRSSPVMTEKKNAMPATEEMVCVISGTLQAFGVTGQGPSASPPPAKVSMEVSEKILAPMAGEVMAVLVESMESCKETLGGGQDAALMLREVALKIQMLSQSDDRDDSCQGGSRSSEEIGDSEGTVSQKDLAIIGSREFHTKASRAVSGILRRSGSSQSGSVQSSRPASAGSSLTQVHDSHVTSPSSTNTFHAHCDAEANKIIDSFVADVKDVAAQAVEAGDSMVQAGGKDHDTASSVDRPGGRPSRRQRVFSATLRLYSNLQSKVAEFFNTGSATGKADLVTSSPLEEPRQEVNSKDIETLSLSECSQSIRAGCDSQTHLDESTMEVIGGILTTFQSMAKVESESSIGRSSEESLAAGVFVGDVLSQLWVFTSSNSPSPSEEMLASSQSFHSLSPELSAKSSTKTTASSIPAIERLCSEGFQTKATKSVSEVLLRSLRDVSAHVFTSRSEPSVRLPSQTSLSPLVVEHEASEIVETFASDFKVISQSAWPGKYMKSLTALIGLIKTLQGKLRGFYARYGVMAQVPPQGEEPLASAEVNAASVFNSNAKSPKSSMSQPILSGVGSGVMMDEGPSGVVLRRGRSEPLRGTPQVSQVFLDTQTKKVVCSLVVLIRSDMSKEEGSSSVPMTWSNESLVISQFVEGIIGWLEDISSSESTSLEGVNITPNEVIRDLTSDRFKRRGTRTVRKVLIKSLRCFYSQSLTSGVSRSHLDFLQGSSTTFAASTDSAAVDIFGTVVDGVKGLFQRGESSTTVGPADSVLLGSFKDPEASESGVSVSEMDIWSTAQRLYKSLCHKFSVFLTVHKRPQAKTQIATLAQAKKSVSQILGVVQDEISKSDLLNRTGELSGIYSLVGNMLKNLEKVYCEDSEPRTTSSTSTSSSKTLRSERMLKDMSFTLPGTPSPSDLQKVISCSIVRSSTIDMSDDDDDKDDDDYYQNDLVLESSLPGARDTMAAIVDTMFSPAELQQASSSSSELTAPLSRLEELLSQDKVQALSRDLVDRLKGLMFEHRNISLHHVGAGRSLSDSVLLKYTQGGRVTRGFCPSELIYAFAEESVKRLLVTLLVPPMTWGLDQKASSSDVSSSGRSFMVSKSSSQSYNQTVNLFTRAMVHQVMDTVSLEPESHEETERVTPLSEMIDGCQPVTCSSRPTLFGTGGCQSSVKVNNSLASGSVRMCVSPTGPEGEAEKVQAEPKGKRRSSFLRFLPKLSQLKASFKRSKKSNKKESQAPEAAQEPKVERCIPALFRRMVSAVNKGLCNPFKKTSRKTQKPN